MDHSHSGNPISCIAESVCVARQPIFDTDRKVFGYELLFRESRGDSCAAVTDGNSATAKVISDGFVLAKEAMGKGQRALINFTSKLLLDGVAYALPADTAVIEILEDVQPTPEILDALKALKDGGYTLALDDYMGEQALAPFLPLVDIVKVDFLGLNQDPDSIRSVVEPLRSFGCTLLAEKIEDTKDFTLACELGFTLFQGYYFSRPEILPGRKLSSSKLARMQLVQELSDPNCEIQQLAKIVQSDLSLSLRLLQYINSIGFGVRYKVDSVARALTLLGQKQLRQWLRVAVMADLSMTEQSHEVAFLSVQRGRFLESMGEELRGVDVSPDALFLLGLFSFVDCLLGVPMQDVLSGLSLDSELKQALLEREGRFAPFLNLSQAYEAGEEASILQNASQLGVPLATADNCYSRSFLWTQQVLGVHDK
ncbi:HDOD domain-containing protein [Desulfobaculum bizertense]|uniref:EAL and HDOD domain-containing protein n=1 Tax=Desulfobaculum bizertense TaxID=376490 RepID=UPI001F2F2E4D|nr:HDOD domain-containing protein [Desulfobaculum bizertense]UIJ37183.1 HDOD domain-containing protein [Desulfobaculum bizertense]